MARSRTEIIESLVVSNTRLTRAAARRTGNPISSAAWTTVSVLSLEGPRRIGDLARLARITQPGMTKIVRGLVEDGWATRIADVDDSRASLITITDRGRKALAEWRTELAGALGEIFSDLDATEWEVLGQAAEILVNHISVKEAAA